MTGGRPGSLRRPAGGTALAVATADYLTERAPAKTSAQRV